MPKVPVISIAKIFEQNAGRKYNPKIVVPVSLDMKKK
jgi:hypothetical protein